MSYTPFNAPLLSGLLGDMEIASFFSVKADLDAMLRFEVALAQAEAECEVIPREAANEIAKKAEAFEPDVRALTSATARDGMVVPEFIHQLRSHVGTAAGEHVHLASTSQDVIDTSLMLRLGSANAILTKRLDSILTTLKDLTTEFGSNSLRARTRMQIALPATVADRLALWERPLAHQRRAYETLAPQLLQLQFGGPVGTLHQLGDKGADVRRLLARQLQLTAPDDAWHTDRTSLSDYAHWLAQIGVALGKIGTDFLLMAQDEIAALTYEGSGSSSAMAHKQNPVKAEALVTLSRFIGTMAAGMSAAGVHEQERSGVSWTLEWMVLPQLVVATGGALRNAHGLLTSIVDMGDAAELS